MIGSFSRVQLHPDSFLSQGPTSLNHCMNNFELSQKCLDKDQSASNLKKGHEPVNCLRFGGRGNLGCGLV